MSSILRQKSYLAGLIIAFCLLCCISSSNVWAITQGPYHREYGRLTMKRYHKVLHVFVAVLICWPASGYCTDVIVARYYKYKALYYKYRKKVPTLEKEEHTPSTPSNPSKMWWSIILVIIFLLVLLGFIYRRQRSRGGK